MTRLATLYPAYNASDFDLEAAQTALKRLVITWEQAIEWTWEELQEGRETINEWEYEELATGKEARFWMECNEYGAPEEWFLTMEDVPFWSAPEFRTEEK